MAKLTFESALKALEALVEELEGGDVPLEKALKKFEEGIKLSTFCNQTLDEMEQKITLLMQTAKGEIQETPFSALDAE